MPELDPEPSTPELSRAGRAFLAAAMDGGSGVTSVLDWRVLNDTSQLASFRRQVVAALYTVPAAYEADGNEHAFVEFCWIPTDDSDHVEVLFGVTEGTEWRDRRNRMVGDALGAGTSGSRESSGHALSA